MFYQIFFLSQVKCAIITYKYGMYELSHELPKDLRVAKGLKSYHLRKLGNISKDLKHFKKIA